MTVSSLLLGVTMSCQAQHLSGDISEREIKVTLDTSVSWGLCKMKTNSSTRLSWIFLFWIKCFVYCICYVLILYIILFDLLEQEGFPPLLLILAIWVSLFLFYVSGFHFVAQTPTWALSNWFLPQPSRCQLQEWITMLSLFF